MDDPTMSRIDAVATATARRLQDRAQTSIRRLVRDSRPEFGTSPRGLMNSVTDDLRAGAVDLAESLRDTRLAGWVAGASSVVRDLPGGLRHADVSPLAWPGGSEWLGVVDGPLDELAGYIGQSDWQALIADTDRQAAEHAAAITHDTAERLGGHLLTNDQSASRAAQDQLLQAQLDTSPIGNRLQHAFTFTAVAGRGAGADHVAEQGWASDLFPYVENIGIADDRQTELCRAVDRGGLHGTAIYRADDPTWQRYKCPRHYGCRCVARYLTIQQAAQSGIREAERWMRLGVPPDSPQYVRAITVPLPLGWVPGGFQLSSPGFPDNDAPYGPGRVVTPDPTIHALAQGYMKQQGRSLDETPLRYMPADEHIGAVGIAKHYQAAPHAPNDPRVQKAYGAFKRETLAQYKYLTDHGYKFEPDTGHEAESGDPHKTEHDIKANRHLYFYTGGSMPADHPLAEKTGIVNHGHEMSYNDVFRVVHDVFGHAQHGVHFGPTGENHAWRGHYQMYSPEARPAMTQETKGQNSWMHFYPGHEKLRRGERPYAEQKANILNLSLLGRDSSKFASTQFDLDDAGYTRTDGSPLEKLHDLQANISKDDLAGDGKEENLHVTVRYGLLTDDYAEVMNAIAGFGSVEAWLGDVTIFAADEAASQRGGDVFDVVKVDVESPDLIRLNKLLGELPHHDTHPDYHPHVTLAYVRPGCGKKYIGAGLNGHRVLLRHLIFSDKQHARTVIDLTAWDAPVAGPDTANSASARLSTIQLSAAWVPYRGPRGGKGWLNTETREIKYQDKSPGDQGGVVTTVTPPEPVAGPGTADRVGVHADAAREYKELGTKSHYFKKWFGDWEAGPDKSSKVVDHYGAPQKTHPYSVVTDDDHEPVVVYHGTTHDFNAFNYDKANPENAIGSGFYFTESEHDAEKNYAGEGPDLTNRIGQRMDEMDRDMDNLHYDLKVSELYAGAKDEAEIRARGAERKIQSYTVDAAVKRFNEHRPAVTHDEVKQELDDIGWATESFKAQVLQDYDDGMVQKSYSDELRQLARNELSGGKPHVMACYLNIRNPVVLGANADHGTRYELYTYPEEDEGVDRDADDYEPPEPEEGPLVKAIRKVALDRYPDVDYAALTEKLHELGDDVTARMFMQEVNGMDDMIEDEQGRIVSSQFAADVFKELGHDGAIFDDASRFFPNMGISRGTRHFVAWRPEQIKSVDNRGTFDPNEKRIDLSVARVLQ